MLKSDYRLSSELLSDGGVVAADLAKSRPGPRRVLMELAKPGSLARSFDNTGSLARSFDNNCARGPRNPHASFATVARERRTPDSE